FPADRALFSATRLRHMGAMKRRFLLAAAVLALAAPALAQAPRPATVAAASAALVTLEGTERAEALAAMNAELNAIQRLQGRFVQTAPDGSRIAGNFYL